MSVKHSVIAQWLGVYSIIFLTSHELDFFFFLLFRATPETYGGSQARGPIGAIAVSC